MTGRLSARRKTALAAIFLMIVLAVYTFQNRYYLRFVPVPLALADVLNTGNALLPTHQPATPQGTIEFPPHDLRTEAGLRGMLNHIQEMSPVDRASGIPNYAGITFDKWVNEITTKPFFCTDATNLFLIAAWGQGLRAREWQLLPAGWPQGFGHSVAEVFNPETERWELVDPQHAAIVRTSDGGIADMLTVLRAKADGRNADIAIDYGPYEAAILSGVRGGTTGGYFFETDLLLTPVLQLRQATWLWSVARAYGISGHLVIGYPLVVDGWTHDHRTWITKIAVLLMGLCGLAAPVLWVRGRAPKLP